MEDMSLGEGTVCINKVIKTHHINLSQLFMFIVYSLCLLYMFLSIVPHWVTSITELLHRSSAPRAIKVSRTSIGWVNPNINTWEQDKMSLMFSFLSPFFSHKKHYLPRMNCHKLCNKNYSWTAVCFHFIFDILRHPVKINWAFLKRWGFRNIFFPLYFLIFSFLCIYTFFVFVYVHQTPPPCKKTSVALSHHQSNRK